MPKTKFARSLTSVFVMHFTEMLVNRLLAGQNHCVLPLPRKFGLEMIWLHDSMIDLIYFIILLFRL